VYLDQTTTLSERQRKRLSESLTTAMRHHEQIRKQSKRLTQSKRNWVTSTDVPPPF
jgi:hypothetical protein